MVHFATVWWFLQTKHALFFFIHFLVGGKLFYNIMLVSAVKVKSFSRVRLFATPWTIAHQAPLSMGFSRQECWSGCHFTNQAQLYTYHLPREPLCPPPFHLSELSYRAKLGTLCYIATSHLLYILHMVVYIYFNANFCIHPTLSFPHRVHTTQSSNHTSWYLPSGTQNLYPCKTST